MFKKPYAPDKLPYSTKISPIDKLKLQYLQYKDAKAHGGKPMVSTDMYKEFIINKRREKFGIPPITGGLLHPLPPAKFGTSSVVEREEERK